MSNAAITGGSDKQNAWAEQIRKGFFEGITAQMGFAKGDRAIVARLTVARDFAAAQNGAKFWIDHRDFGKAIAALLVGVSAETVTAMARAAYDAEVAAKTAVGESEADAIADGRDVAGKVVTALVDYRGKFDRKAIVFTFEGGAA